jgi:hypothetical protein
MVIFFTFLPITIKKRNQHLMDNVDNFQECPTAVYIFHAFLVHLVGVFPGYLYIYIYNPITYIFNFYKWL